MTAKQVDPQHSASPPRPSRLGATLRALIRTRLTAGIITILPILVTLWVVRLVFGWMRDASGWAVKGFLLSPAGKPYLEQLHFDFDRWERLADLGLLVRQQQFFELMPPHIQWTIAIFSVFLTIFFLYLVGLLAANIFGKRLIHWLEQLVDRVPLIKTVYRGLKQILANFSADQTQNFQRVAMIPFLAPGVYSLGFVTNIFKDAQSGEEYVTVFYATTPNPTTGFVLIMKRSDIVELDWSVEEAVKVIISGGILMPPQASVPQSLRLREALVRPEAFSRPPGAPPA
jgi:uncharacterized membrane protein